jgi:hypothetical protein
MKKRYVGIAVAILALGTIIAGFFIVGTPAQARLARFDAQKVSDLQNIQSQVITYWQAKQKLPTAIGELDNSLAFGTVPVDPQTGAPYEYHKTGTLSFQLCATFNAESRGTAAQAIYDQPRAVTIVGGKAPTDNWQHSAGSFCYDRAIDPAFFPPLTK